MSSREGRRNLVRVCSVTLRLPSSLLTRTLWIPFEFPVKLFHLLSLFFFFSPEQMIWLPHTNMVNSHVSPQRTRKTWDSRGHAVAGTGTHSSVWNPPSGT